jgi:hypothetical protein
MAESVEGAGGAPAVNTSTVWSNGRRTCSSALTIMFRTIGAPPKWVTPSRATAS